MTTIAFSRRRRIELLLNTLAGERHARKSLLSEIIDLAEEDPEFAGARAAATTLLEAAERPLDEREFQKQIATIEAQLP